MEEELPKEDVYFAQLHELYLNFKIAMKKWKPVEDETNESVVPETVNDAEPDWVEASKHLTSSILGGIDAKFEGLTPTDPFYYRLLGMKSSIMVDRSKILANLEQDEESFQVLDDALALLVDIPPRPETSYMVLRLINHFGYVLSVEENFEKAKQVLLEGERIYSLIGQEDLDTGFLASDDLFSESNEPSPRDETTAYLEKLATNNVQMLGFVHGRLGDWVKFATCGHRALRRQLEGREGEAVAWAARAARLALHFLTRNHFREARTHLAAATHVLETYEVDLRSVERDEQVDEKIVEVDLRAADIGRAWTKYALQLLEASSQDEEQLSSECSSSASTSDEDGEDGEDEEDGEDGEDGEKVAEEVGADGDSRAAADGQVWDKMVAAERKREKSGKKRLETLAKETMQDQGDVVIEAVKEDDDDAVDILECENAEKEAEVQGTVEEAVDNDGDKEVKPAVDCIDVAKEMTPEVQMEEGGVVQEEEEKGTEEVKEGEKEKENEEEKTTEEVKENEEVKESEEEKQNEEEKETEDCCGLHVVDEEADDDEEDDFEGLDLTFPSLDLDYIYEDVTSEPVDTAEKARSMMHYVGAWYERVMRVYDLAKHPELHVAAVMDQAELLRYLAGYAPMDAAYILHRTRSNSLEEVCDELKDASPKVFSAASSDLYRELADVQLEMMTLNLRRLDVVNGDAERRDARRQCQNAD